MSPEERATFLENDEVGKHKDFPNAEVTDHMETRQRNHEKQYSKTMKQFKKLLLCQTVVNVHEIL